MNTNPRETPTDHLFVSGATLGHGHTENIAPSHYWRNVFCPVSQGLEAQGRGCG